MASRSLLGNPDWASAYIISTSSHIIDGDLPLPTIPQSVSESLSLNTNDQSIVARWAPIITYINTNARQISFTFAIADDYMPMNPFKGRAYTIQEYINALKSLEYPDYITGSKSSEVVSPQCILKIANIKAKGIVTSVSVNWNGPLSSAISGGTYSRADITIQFKEIANTVKGAINIKGFKDSERK